MTIEGTQYYESVSKLEDKINKRIDGLKHNLQYIDNVNIKRHEEVIKDLQEKLKAAATKLKDIKLILEK